MGSGLKLREVREFDYLDKTIDPITLNYFDFDYFIQLAKDKNKNISLYPVNEDSWFDVGRWSEYRKETVF